MKKKSTLSWVLEFAGRKSKYFGWSVVLAIFGVALSFAPYLLMSDMVVQLINGNKDWNYFLNKLILMAACWVLRLTLHSISTSLSHMGTFNVLGTVRRQLCEKLSTIPLGSVLADNSGAYKNIIVERVDSMETTLAHIIPEFTANIILPIVIFIYLLTVDWRMGLANLISVVIGGFLAGGMLLKSRGGYEISVQKTKVREDRPEPASADQLPADVHRASRLRPVRRVLLRHPGRRGPCPRGRRGQRQVLHPDG